MSKKKRKKQHQHHTPPQLAAQQQAGLAAEDELSARLAALPLEQTPLAGDEPEPQAAPAAEPAEDIGDDVAAEIAPELPVVAEQSAEGEAEFAGDAASADVPEREPAAPVAAAPVFDAQAEAALIVRPRRERPALLLWFGFILAQELLLRCFIYPQPLIAADVGYIALFSLFYAGVLRLLSGWLTRRGNRVLALLLALALTLLYVGQYVYFLFFKTPVLVFSIFQAAQVTEFSAEVGTMLAAHWWQCLCFALPLLLLVRLGRRSFRPLHGGRVVLVLLSMAAVAVGLGYTLPLSGSGPTSAYTVFYNDNNPAQSQQRLGMLTELTLDAVRSLCGFAPKDAPEAVSLPLSEEPMTEQVAEQVAPPAKNVMDIDFDALLAAETDPDLRAMHEYFSTRPATSQNDYTGRYAGCNLIYITAEGFSHYLLDPELCPTLYMLATEGFEFTNMYTPIWNVSTSDGEYVALTGLYPKSGVWSFSRSSENYLPFALGNQFSAIGYPQPLAYHNHSFSYSDRDLSHPNLGYDFRAPGHGLDIVEQWPESDVEMIENSTPQYLGTDSPFHVYYMTVSGHLEYNFSGNNMARKHEQDVADLPYSDQVRAYIACNLELENMLTLLLEQLVEAGELLNTVIVLSADHYPYGLSEDSLNELAGHEVERTFELYRNGLIIWKYGEEHQVISDPVASVDIIPTVSNLFGLEYDSRLLMGRDVFAPDSFPLVIFNDRSWITDAGSYDAESGQVTGELNDYYVETMNKLVNAKLAYSAQLLDTDYYRLVLGQ